MKIRIPKPEGIDKRLLEQFQKVRSGRRRGERMRVEQRASSFPICPRKYHIYRRLPIHKRPFEDDTFIRDSATLEGTALHLAVQKWFGISMPDHAFGNWGCPECKKIRRHKRGVQLCKKCGNEMIYVEYAVRKMRETPFTGHIDMILWYRDIRYLVDFKGSSMNKIKDIQKDGPKYEHYLQTNAYANAINIGNQSMGPLDRIDKIVIIYIDRGQPWWKWWPVQMPVSKRVYRESISLIKKAHASLETMQAPRGICDSAADPGARWCEAKSLCFDPLLETKLDDIIHPEDTRAQDRRLDNEVESRQKDGKDYA